MPATATTLPPQVSPPAFALSGLPPHELAGIVVADHADVLGHYDRTDMFMDDAPLNLGLFHSGAGFNDNEFYALYDRVAEVLIPQMR